jgi:hypothetical protein
VREGDGHSSKADVGGYVADGVHEGGAKDLAKLILADALQDRRGGRTDAVADKPCWSLQATTSNADLGHCWSLAGIVRLQNRRFRSTGADLAQLILADALQDKHSCRWAICGQLLVNHKQQPQLLVSSLAKHCRNTEIA